MNKVFSFKSAVLTGCSGIAHGFFSRNGGVSSNEYDSLNCSLSSGDGVHEVAENRSRVSMALGCDSIISLRQIHSNRVFVVDRSWDGNQVVEGDGMVTIDSGIALGVLGADCAPVLFADSDVGIIGAAHAGWKGAVLGVTDNIIKVMCDLGSRPDKIRASVGPAIQQRSYEVGLEFAGNFAAQSEIECGDFFLYSDNTAYFDLPGYILKRLELAGIEQVDVLDEDTYTDEQNFFSYRRMCHRKEQKYGRQIGAISLV